MGRSLCLLAAWLVFLIGGIADKAVPQTTLAAIPICSAMGGAGHAPFDTSGTPLAPSHGHLCDLCLSLSDPGAVAPGAGMALPLPMSVVIATAHPPTGPPHFAGRLSLANPPRAPPLA